MPCTQQEHLAGVGGKIRKKPVFWELMHKTSETQCSVFELPPVPFCLAEVFGWWGGFCARKRLSPLLSVLQNAVRPSVLSWSVSGLAHWTRGAGEVGVMATVLSWCLKDFSNSKRREMLRVQTVAEIGVIQSEWVIAWTHAVFFFRLPTPTKVVNKAQVKVPYTPLSMSFLDFTPSWWSLQ